MSSPDATGTSAVLRSPLTMSDADWTRTVVAHGGRPQHARALREAVLRRGIEDFQQAHSPGRQLPGALLEGLRTAGVRPRATRLAARRAAADGSTKLAVELADGNHVECVHMPGRRSASVCISAQLGCPIACRFCASGLGGLVRNLSTGEILEQLAHVRGIGRYDRIVVMGIGEPLLNLDALIPALDLVRDALPLDEHRITLSTVGSPERVRALHASGRRYRLALSLHAPDDSLRAELIPGRGPADVAEVVQTAADYARSRDERLQVEYVVLAGVNDDDARLDLLLQLLRPHQAYVNFIPWNPVAEMPYQRPTTTRLRAMVRHCRDQGLLATCRYSAAADVDGACGQLRRSLRA